MVYWIAFVLLVNLAVFGVRWRRWSSGIRVKAMVTETVESDLMDGNDEPTYWAKVRFRDREGQVHERTLERLRYRRYEAGEILWILYREHDPEWVESAEWLRFWGPALLLLLGFNLFAWAML